jgi:hypothetical protein
MLMNMQDSGYGGYTSVANFYGSVPQTGAAP